MEGLKYFQVGVEYGLSRMYVVIGLGCISFNQRSNCGGVEIHPGWRRKWIVEDVRGDRGGMYLF